MNDNFENNKNGQIIILLTTAIMIFIHHQIHSLHQLQKTQKALMNGTQTQHQVQIRVSTAIRI